MLAAAKKDEVSLKKDDFPGPASDRCPAEFETSTNAETTHVIEEMSVSLAEYKQVKKEREAIQKRFAKAEYKKKEYEARKENGGAEYEAHLKFKREKMRDKRAAVKDIGLKETPKSERVSRAVKEMQGKL